MQMLDRIIAAIRAAVFAARGLEARVEDKIETAIDGPLTKAEVDAMLAKALQDQPALKDYDRSIVDLLKLLHLDSSMAARRKLAAELGVTQYSGTAEQNVELHRNVMEQIANREFNR